MTPLDNAPIDHLDVALRVRLDDARTLTSSLLNIVADLTDKNIRLREGFKQQMTDLPARRELVLRVRHLEEQLVEAREEVARYVRAEMGRVQQGDGLEL